jgi:hypothetical protein
MFDENLTLQENNITETGEEIITRDLRSSYEKYIATLTSIGRRAKPYSVSDFAVLKPQYERARDYVLNIYDLNIKAIVARNDIATQKADRVVKYVNVLGIICLSLAGIFILFYLSYLMNIRRSKKA